MLYIVATLYSFACNVILGLALYKVETENKTLVSLYI